MAGLQHARRCSIACARSRPRCWAATSPAPGCSTRRPTPIVPAAANTRADWERIGALRCRAASARAAHRRPRRATAVAPCWRRRALAARAARGAGAHAGRASRRGLPDAASRRRQVVGTQVCGYRSDGAAWSAVHERIAQRPGAPRRAGARQRAAGRGAGAVERDQDLLRRHHVARAAQHGVRDRRLQRDAGEALQRRRSATSRAPRPGHRRARARVAAADPGGARGDPLRGAASQRIERRACRSPTSSTQLRREVDLLRDGRRPGRRVAVAPERCRRCAPMRSSCAWC